MRVLLLLLAPVVLSAVAGGQALPPNLVGEGLPPLDAELRDRLHGYTQFREAGFCDWHPRRREMLITTRFGASNQLHLVTAPGGARRQITFANEPLTDGDYHPVTGESILFTQSVGGSEDDQIFLQDLASGEVVRLTDGTAKFGSPRWSRDGTRVAYISYAHSEFEPEVWVMPMDDPARARAVFRAPRVGWGIVEWSADGALLLLSEYVSVNETRVHLLDLASGEARQVLPRPGGARGSFSPVRLAPDGKSLFMASNQNSEMRILYRVDLASGERSALSDEIAWDVQDFALNHDASRLAFLTNEDGAGVLHLRDLTTGHVIPRPALPAGSVSGLKWHPDGTELAFTVRSARLPSDVFSLDLARGVVSQWTASEPGPFDAARFPETARVSLESFDGLKFSAMVVRPDPAVFPGPRPVLVLIHGGPEGQSREGFWGGMNFYLRELGIALVIPNVRGSSGYGKTFLDLDNGFKREDSVKDIGAVLDWIARDEGLDAGRVAVTGGSYGGYMVLACLVHFSDRLRCGVESVGISNFVTFLENTRDYRRDLRRVEYGDERDPEMRAFLEKISPANNVAMIRKPLFVMQGANDPRVPASESAQVVKALREAGGEAWYLLAKDEGHGFRKQHNREVALLLTVQFLQKYLLE